MMSTIPTWEETYSSLVSTINAQAAAITDLQTQMSIMIIIVGIIGISFIVAATALVTRWLLKKKD